MILEIAVDTFDLVCKVTHAKNNPPDYRNAVSDHDYRGGPELDFEVLSGRSRDDEGRFTPITNEWAQAVADLNEAHIKSELWFQLEARRAA